MVMDPEEEVHDLVDPEAPELDPDAVLPQDSESILDLFKELKSAGDEESYDYLLIGERNERWVSGDQWSDINPMSGLIVDAWQSYLPRVSQNYLRGLVNTFKARVTQQRPSVTAFAANPTPEAARAATISSKLIDYLEKEMQIDVLIDEVVKVGTMHGTAGFKIIYNPEADKVEWFKVSIEDYLIDPTADSVDDADWVIFRSCGDKYDVKRQFKAAGIQDAPPEEEFRIAGRKRSGVPVYELWHKPSARVPNGLYCKVIGNHVLDSMDYPYMMPSLENPGQQEPVLPIVLFRVDYKRGSQYGETWLSDTIPQQRQVNEVESTMVELRRKIGNIKLVVESDAVRQALSTNSQIIQSASVPQFMAPPQIPQLLFADRDFFIKKIYDVAGINDSLVGTASMSGASGRALAYQDELDSAKHSGCTKSIESMLIKAWKLTLQLVQMFYLGDRVMRITADSGGFDTMSFQGSEIMGITVDLSPRSGKERMPQSKIAQFEADAQAGIVDPKLIPNVRATGLPVTADAHQAKQIIQNDVKAILRGAQPVANPQLDANVAVEELHSLHSLLLQQGVTGAPLIAIEALAEAYLASLQPQAAPVPPQAPPAAPPEMMPLPPDISQE